MLTVMFTCHGCHLERIKVKVTARQSASVDLKEWMDQTMLECQAMHSAFSPLCQEGKLDLYIPTGKEDCGAEWIGDQRCEAK